MFLYQIYLNQLKSQIFAHVLLFSFFYNLMFNTMAQEPHRLDWRSGISIRPVLSFSTLTPTLTNPRSSTLPWTPVSPALSALWGICISYRVNSHSTVQSGSRSHLPLVSERSFCVYTSLLPLHGSAAAKEHDSQECSPLHYNLPNQMKPQHY